MQINLTRRSFLRRSLGGASLLCLPSALFAKYEEEADASANEVVLRFSALSDVHFKKTESKEVGRFRRSMEFMYDYSSKQPYKNFDAMLVAGDMTDHGWDEELLPFKKVMDEGIKEGTATILCMGNHEFNGGNKPRWEDIFERPANKVHDVNGFKFIALSPEKGTCRNGDYLYALDWYAQELDKARADDSGKPVFTFQHYHITPTVYGSRGEDNWGTVDLFETLQKYPRVVNFSGHSHYPINDPRSAWQGRFSAFGTGTLSYFEMGGEGGKFNKFPPGYDRAAQLFVVEVRKDNTVVLKPYDLITETFFDVVYVVNPGNIDKYSYTDERYKTSVPPTWLEGSKAACVDVNSDFATLTFPQASCPDVVHSYRITLEKETGGAWEEFSTQYFWSEYYFQDQPEEMRVELDAASDSTFRAKIVVLNPFFKESEKALEIKFTTPKDELDQTDKNAAAPDANVLDVQFKDGKVVNAAVNGLKTQKEVQTFGKPKIAEVAALGALAAAFNGKDERYKIQFNTREYRKLGNATIAAKFVFKEFGASENMVVFANTQGAGLSLELDSKTKSLEFWASVDGTYQIISAPVEPGKAIEAFGTYDGKTLVLYINGKEAAKKEVTGRLTYPTNESVQAFCIGSDIAEGGSGSNFFNGSVSRARLFSWGLTAEQVENLSK
ncbi:MAG: metallophosphoesterase [Thermoguttaceae bacterium]|nr:metallophosphoesterase [Thermoguttaceae bacterium]